MITQHLSRRRFIGPIILMLATIGCHNSPLISDKSSASLDPPVKQAHKVIKTDNLSADESADACIETARELERNGWEREAIVVYQRALKFAPKQKGVARRLARLEARAGNAKAARKHFETALTETPNEANLLNDYGFFLYEHGEFSKAEELLRKALDQKPQDTRFQTNLARVFAAQKRYEQSLDLFEKAVGPAAALSNLAILLTQQGEYKTAEILLDESIALEPNLAQAIAAREGLRKIAD